MPPKSLTEKTTKGVVWNSFDRIANYGIGFIVGIVLARLLSPEEYGLIGIIGIFTSIFNVILDSGLSTSLIRKDKVTDIDYCTVFHTNLVLSLFLTAVLFFGAPLIASFFKRPELVSYIHVMSFIFIINALSITQQVRLTKKIDFKTLTKISIIAHTLSGIIGIVMALCHLGVWALVFQQLTSRLFNSVLLWVYNKWIPRLVFSWESFTSLFSFSWKLLVAQIIASVWGQLYHAVIGRVYSPEVLGQYTRANQYTHLPASIIGDVVLKVSLPVMSEIQNEDERLLRAFRRIIKLTMFVSSVILVGIAASADSLIYVLIGEKWMACVPMMQILCASFVIYPMQQININMLTVLGRSDILLLLQVIKCVLAIGPILLGIYCGINWMLVGSVVIGWIALLLNSYYSGKKFNYKWWNQITDIAPSLGIALLMGAIVYALSFLPVSPYVMLPLQVIVGSIVIFLFCETIQYEPYVELKGIAASYVNKIRNNK